MSAKKLYNNCKTSWYCYGWMRRYFTKNTCRKIKVNEDMEFLLENIQDLDPEYSKLVDDNFWSLT